MSTNQPGSGAGPLRTTLEIDRLFVQQIYVRTANNIPISTGFVLLADGKGGTTFGPAAIQSDYFSLSSMISAGTASFQNTLSTSFIFNINQISSGFYTINSQIASTYGGLTDAQSFINQNIIDLSNLIVNISTYSSFVQSANQPFSTLSSYIINISNTYTPNTTTYQLHEQSISSFYGTQSTFISNFSVLTGTTNNTFNVYSSFQQQLYINNLSTISTSYRGLITTTSGNYSTLSTTIGNQQASYNQSLSTGMSSYMMDYSTIIGNNIYNLNQNQSTLLNTVSTLSTLFFSVATYSISSQITLLNSTLSTSIQSNIVLLSSQLSTIKGTAIFSLENSIATVADVSNSLNTLSTTLQVNYSTLATELSITQTRGINSQLYYQFYQLGITQSSILANNTSSIQYLSTVITNTFSTANYRFSTLVNTNYSTLLTIGYSSIVIANIQVTQSTILLLQSTLSATTILLTDSSNTQSTFLGTTLSTNYGRTISTNVATLKTINFGSQVIQSTFYESLSSFSSSVYPFIFNMSNSLSTVSKNLTDSVSNWALNTVSNEINTDINTVRDILTNANQGVATNPVVIELSNLAFGIISTTYSTLSSYTRTFAGFSTANVFTNDITFNGQVNATNGVFTQFFQICNIISTYTYTYTGSNIQTYIPNRFASQVLVQMWGAGGGAGTNTNGGGGAYVEGIIAVDPTQIYNIKIGGGGVLSSISDYEPYNGGGRGISTFTGSGGGATTIFFNTTTCNVAVAAGGGGGGFISTFADWNSSEFATGSRVQFSLSNSLFSNQQLGYSTYGNYLASVSTMGTFVSLFNFSSFSTATSINFTTLFNYSTFSYSSFSSFVVSPFLIYNLSSASTATSISFSSISSIQFSTSNLLNYSTFNMSTMSTINYVYSSIIFSGAASNSTLVPFVNSTIYLLCGSWGGPGGIQTGFGGQNPFSSISSGDFALGGNGGDLPLNTASCNIMTRSVSADNGILSQIVKQSTFITYVGDFIPQLMGYSPYLFSSLSTLLSTTSNNSTNYSFVSTNVLQNTLFSNYFSTVQDKVPNNSSTLAFYYTVRDLYSLQNTFQPNSLPLVGLTTKVDYTTDKTPTGIYSADLSFTISQLGSPYGIAAHLMSFPFDKSDDVLYSCARLYISSLLSTIKDTRSLTNQTGLKYFNKEGTISSYNGTYQTEGIYCNALDRYTYQYLSTLVKYDNLIYAPSTIEVILTSISTLSSLIAYNFSSFSTATSVEFSTLSNYSTFNYSTFSSFVVSPYLIYNLSSFSTVHTNGAVAVSTIQFSPYNVLNYSTFNMSTMSTINYVYSSITFSGFSTTGWFLSSLTGGLTYQAISTMGTYVSLFNFSSFSTATSINFSTLANYSTFNYSSFSTFVVSPFYIYNLSSFSTATSISFSSFSSIQFSPSNLLNYSTFNMSTMSTINYVYSTIFLTDQQNYNINTSTIISSLYRQIFGGVQYKDVPPTFAPYVYDAFFPIAANSTLTSLVENGGFVINYNTQGDFFTNFFETSTLIKSSRKMYNIFVSSAGANGESLINSLPITISSLTREPALQSTATTFNTNTLVTYISNYFQSQDFTEQGFTINDILIDFKTIADFPTVKLYIQKLSTITYFDIIKPDPQEFRNTVYYGAAGDFLRGGDATFISPNSTRGIGGGGGGAGFKGGQAGGFTTAVAGATSQIQNKYFIGGGGGGGGSSYIAPLTGTGNSLPGQTFNSGYTTHPLASALKSGQGGIDSNSFNNYLYPSTFSSITTPFLSKKGGDGLLILTEFVDPFRIVVSNGTQYFVPLRIDAATNEVVVNKLVISSAQVVTMSATHPSSFYLDFANYQQFYLTLKDHEVSSFHIIPLTTISSPTMNFQTGNIYLNISTFSTNAVIDFSSFNIENTWNQDTPGVLSSYGNRSTYLFEYSIFNSNIYLTTPRTW